MPENNWEQIFNQLRKDSRQDQRELGIPRSAFGAAIFAENGIFKFTSKEQRELASKRPRSASENLSLVHPENEVIKAFDNRPNKTSIQPSPTPVESEGFDFVLSMGDGELLKKNASLNCGACLPEEIKDHPLALGDGQDHKAPIDILIVGEPGTWEVMDLWMKMIQAMLKIQCFQWKLELLTQCSDDSVFACKLRVLQQIKTLSPKRVISFGALSTNLLLNEKLKLSQGHGKSFRCLLDDFAFELIPIFHPYFLKLNPSMKRTAWNDLQNILKLWA